MKKAIATLVCTFLGANLALSQPLEFEPAYMASENIEPSRSQFITFRSKAAAVSGDVSKSQNLLSMDGEWFLNVINGAATQSRLEDFIGEDENLSQWKKVNLPSSAELAKVGQSVLLARDITVPFDYTDQAQYINLGVSSTPVVLYVNGQRVGSSTDSKGRAEFNVSKFTIRGRNRIVLLLESESPSKSLEQGTDQSIKFENSSYLFAQPKIRIFDIMATSSLDPSYENGLLEIAMVMKSELFNPHTIEVFYDLYDSDGKIVNRETRSLELERRQGDTLRFTSSIMDVNKWSYEDPKLYTAVFSIKRHDRFTEYISARVGFREVLTRDKTVFVNGQKVLFHGVNADLIDELIDPREDYSAMIQAIKNLRAMGVNAIKTPYPLSTAFYDACDSVGMYVVANANINSRAMSKSIMKGGTLANDPAWRDMFVERALRNYENLKLHPSVIAWGLGEEAGNGYNMYQAYLAIRSKDALRPIVYGGAAMEWNTDWYMPSQGDKQYGIELQPLVYSRIADTDLWDSANGGFLGQGTLMEGERKGDQVKTETLKSVSLESLSAKISPKYAYVSIEALDATKGIFKVTNRLEGANLSEYGLGYRIYNRTGNSVVKEGVLPLEVNPGGEGQTLEVEGVAGRPVELWVGSLCEAEFNSQR